MPETKTLCHAEVLRTIFDALQARAGCGDSQLLRVEYRPAKPPDSDLNDTVILCIAHWGVQPYHVFSLRAGDLMIGDRLSENVPTW